MEKRLSEEHRRLLEQAREERLDDQSFDLPGVRRSYNELSLESITARVYGQFTLEQLQSTRLKLNLSNDKSIIRIDRIPKSVRDFSRKHKIHFSDEGTYRFTVKEDKATEDLLLMSNDHPLYKLALAYAEQDVQRISLPTCSMKCKVNEPMIVELNEISFVNGQGRELERSLLLMAKRANGAYIRLSSNWLFSDTIKGTEISSLEGETFKGEVIKQARLQLITLRLGREELLNRKSQFLRRSFDTQMTTLYERLQRYQTEDVAHKNSALINQTISQIEDLEERRHDRLEEIERERSIQLRSVKKVAQFKVQPYEDSPYSRLIPNDFESIVKNYETHQGRLNLKRMDAYGLVDFISEDTEGVSRYIILTTNEAELSQDLMEQDYCMIREHVYVYKMEGEKVVYEVPLIDII